MYEVMVKSGLLGKLYFNVISITNYSIGNISNPFFIIPPIISLITPPIIPLTTPLTTPPTILLTIFSTISATKTIIYFS